MLRTATAADLFSLRVDLSRCFASDTAAPGTSSSIPSAGHCAAVAVIVHAFFGGEFVSAVVMDQSHWFNRLVVDGNWCDVDLTGDQFPPLAPIRLDVAGRLYPGTRVRAPQELRDEALQRAALLAQRARMDAVAARLRGDCSPCSS